MSNIFEKECEQLKSLILLLQNFHQTDGETSPLLQKIFIQANKKEIPTLNSRFEGYERGKLEYEYERQCNSEIEYEYEGQHNSEIEYSLYSEQ